MVISMGFLPYLLNSTSSLTLSIVYKLDIVFPALIIYCLYIVMAFLGLYFTLYLFEYMSLIRLEACNISECQTAKNAYMFTLTLFCGHIFCGNCKHLQASYCV